MQMAGNLGFQLPHPPQSELVGKLYQGRRRLLWATHNGRSLMQARLFVFGQGNATVAIGQGLKQARQHRLNLAHHIRGHLCQSQTGSFCLPLWNAVHKRPVKITTVRWPSCMASNGLRAW